MLDKLKPSQHTTTMSGLIPSEVTTLLIEAQSTDRLARLSVPSNAAEQQALFMAGEIENPLFLFDDLVDFKQQEKRALTDAYKKAVFQLPLPDYEQRVYDAFGQSLDTEIALGEVAKDAALLRETNGDLSETTQRFLTIRDEVYGELPVERYYDAVQYLRQKFNKLSEIPELTPHLDFIIRHTPLSPTTTVEPFFTEASTKRVVAAVETFGLQPKDETEKGGSDADRVVRSIQHYLHHLIEATHWDAEAADILEPASTDRLQSTVRVNNNLKLANQQHFTEITAHEGFHAYRAIMAQQIGSTALLIGLPGSHAIEEGLATTFGKVHSNAVGSLDSFDYPVFVAGLMDHEHCDFRTSYEVFWRVLMLFRYTTNNQLLQINAAEESQQLAYRILCNETRVFDKPRYRSLANNAGVRDAWSYLDAHHDDPVALQTLLIGKHDPSNSEHQSYLQNYI